MNIGYAQTPITPPLTRPVYLAGFGRNRTAVSIHDDLTVRALALVDGETQVVVAALDLIGLARDHCQELEKRIRQTFPAAQLLIACTHTHHGPDTIGLWGPDEMTSGVDPVYMANLYEAVVETAVTALSNLQPAHLRRAAVTVIGLAKNARDPEIRDEELTCLQFCHVDSQRPLATWLIYPCHPEVLWDGNPHITADYIHTMRQVVEAASGAPCLPHVGALGGMMTPDVVDHSFAEAEAMGRVLAEAALATLEKCEATAVPTFRYTRHEYSLPLENPLFQMAATIGLLPDRQQADGTILTGASLLQLGDAWLLGVPGELLPKLGLQYKKMMQEAGGRVTAVIGLANDELGYLLPAEDFTAPANYLEPGDSYEESMSVSAQAGPMLTQVVERLLG